MKQYRRHLEIAKGEISSILPKCRVRSRDKFGRKLRKNSKLIKLQSSKFEKEILYITAKDSPAHSDSDLNFDRSQEPNMGDEEDSQDIDGTKKRKHQSDYEQYECHQDAKRPKMSQPFVATTSGIYNEQIDNNNDHMDSQNVGMIVRKRKWPQQNEQNHNHNHNQGDLQSTDIERAKMEHIVVPSLFNVDDNNLVYNWNVKNVSQCPKIEHNNSHHQSDMQSTNFQTAMLEHIVVPSLFNNDNNNIGNNGYMANISETPQNVYIDNCGHRNIQSTNCTTAKTEHNVIPSLYNNDKDNVPNSGFFTSVPSVKASMKFINRSIKARNNSGPKNPSHSLGTISNAKLSNLTSGFPCDSKRNHENTESSTRQDFHAHSNAYFAAVSHARNNTMYF